jgi:myo-inositol-1(or 4)-monophosphatase
MLTIIKEIVLSVAKQELVPRFAKVCREVKADGSFLTEADLVVQERIFARLRKHWPDYMCLGEEMDINEQQRLLASNQPVWVLDPLDGTSNFASGIPYFCVSLALLQGGQVSLGIVYDPIRDECFMADKETGATLNNIPLKLTDSGLSLEQTSAIIDFKRLPQNLATRLATKPPYSSQRSFGSVALDWCWLAAGRGQLYLHGKQNIWDYIAGQFIFQYAGGYSSTLSGEPVFINELTPRAVYGAADAHLFEAWQQWLDINSIPNK